MKSLKSIKTKLLITILGVAFGFSLLLFIVTISELQIQKGTIQRKSSKEAKMLSNNTQDTLSVFNRQIAMDYSSACNKYFNLSFANIRRHVTSVSTEISGLYNSDNSMPLDNSVGIMGGIKRNEIESEFGKIAGIRRFIKNLPSYDPDPQKLKALDLYVVTESGMCLDGTFSSYPGNYPDLRKEDWYKHAKKQKDIYWSGLFKGKVTHQEKVTCVQSFFDQDNNFRGCAAGDISVDEFQEMLEKFDEKQIKSVIFFDSQGKLMYATNDYENVHKVESCLNQQEIVETDNEIYSFSTLEETGWSICLVLDQEAVNKTAVNMQTAIEKNAEGITDIVRGSIRRSIFLFVIIVAAGALLVFVITNFVAAGFVKPIRQLTNQVGVVGTGNLEQVISVDTKDEIGQLAGAFNKMLEELKEYMKNLQLVTTDKERMAAEADVAMQIQKNMLPNTFPAFPERNDFDVYAMLRSVEKGGSNFYDFFMVDKSHFCIVIGDVAGSGVPATMFAVVTRTHIKNYAKLGYHPDRILVETNNQLSEKNDAGLTVSVFIGLVDLLSGNMQYVSAGAQTPFWKHSGGDFDVLPCNSCFALANMANVPYVQQAVRLAQGDMLFLYTQGVPKTVDAKGNEYTEEYLQGQLNELMGQEYQLKGLMENINETLEQFSEDVPQKQDGTMVVFRYFGRA